MKHDNLNYVVVGSFVLAMLALLFFSLYKITGRGSDTETYYIIFKNVSGIRVGTGVTYAGFYIGKVMDIEPIRDQQHTQYKLTLGIRSNWPIPVDSRAQLITPGLLAEKQIDISEGQAQRYLQPGEHIQGYETADMFKVMNDIAGEFQTLADSGLKPLLQTLNKDLTGNVPGILQQTTQLVKRLNDSANKLSNLLDSLPPERIAKIVDNAEAITGNLAVMSSQLQNTSSKIEQLLTRADNLMQENNQGLNAAVVDLRKSMQVIAENINGIVYHLDASARNMNEFTRQLRDNPAVILNSKPPTDNAKSK